MFNQVGLFLAFLISLDIYHGTPLSSPSPSPLGSSTSPPSTSPPSTSPPSPLGPSTSSPSIDLTNVFNKCLKNRQTVSIKSQVKLSSLLSCDRDSFNIELNNTTITGLYSYRLTPFKRINKDEYEAIMWIPAINVQSNYRINGPVAHMFPVNGQGTIKMDYVDISVHLGVKKTGKSNDSVILYGGKIDFKNSGHKVINDHRQTIDNKTENMDKTYEDSIGKVIFWQIFNALKEEPDYNVSVNCLEESIQSSKLLDNLDYITFDDDDFNDDPIVEIIPYQSGSYHSAIYADEGYSRFKRDTPAQLPMIPEEEFKESHWYKKAEASLESILDYKRNEKIAKNVILFIGDGMGISTITAARILKEQLAGGPGNGNNLFFEHFKQSALIKTFNLDRQTPDSAGTATAFTCGIKANYGTLGVSGRIFKSEKDCSVIKTNAVPSIFTWAQLAKKGTGIVTTTRITHATPAAGYAHVASRDWESDTDTRRHGAECKDIARQLIEDAPGNNLNVIMGGGWRSFAGPNITDPTPSAGSPGIRTDGVNLVDRWISDRQARGANWSFVTNTSQLRSVDTSQTDYLFGLFNRDHLPYELERDQSPQGSPSLAEMVESAVKVLSKHENGFVLLVEGGLVDIAHHENYAQLSLHEVIGLDSAIEKATELLPMDETLIIVTADHSHGFVINGYPLRGNDILGVSDYKEEPSDKTFSTLMYTTGPGHVEPRPDEILVSQRNDARYRFHSAINMSSAVHGGEDVAAYATGPMSHLINGLQDQSYIAHVIAYSSCIGQYSKTNRCQSQTINAAQGINNLPAFIYVILSVFLFTLNSIRLENL